VVGLTSAPLILPFGKTSGRDRGAVAALIPGGLPHFVAAKESAVIVQLSGGEKFRTEYVEK
jgi:hypothetical protein